MFVINNFIYRVFDLVGKPGCDSLPWSSAAELESSILLGDGSAATFMWCVAAYGHAQMYPRLKRRHFNLLALVAENQPSLFE